MPVILNVSDALAAAANHTLAPGTQIQDTTRNVSESFDALQGIAGSLGSISFTNGGRPAFAITPSQLTADAAALALIPAGSPYYLEQRITAAQAGTSAAVYTPPFKAIAVVDTVANITANLPAIEALYESGHLGAVRMTDGGTPVFHLSAARVSANLPALARITLPFPSF